MKKCIQIGFVLLLFSTTIVGQDLNALYQDYLTSKRHDYEYFKTVKGSPYENSSFDNAKIYLKKDTSFLVWPLRYNGLFDEMEMKDPNGDGFLIVDNKSSIDSIVLYGETYRYLRYIWKGQSKDGFFIQVLAGKCNLYIRRVREYKPAQKPTGGYQTYISPSIVENPEAYFAGFGEAPLEELPNTMNGIIRFFQEKRYNLGDVVKKERLRHNRDDLIKLIGNVNKR